MNNIGESLREQREKAKKSVYDIEKELGLTHQSQYRWETGKQEPSIITCIKLADYYGITLDELVGRDI